MTGRWHLREPCPHCSHQYTEWGSLLQYYVVFHLVLGHLHSSVWHCSHLVTVLLGWWKSNCCFGPWILNHYNSNTSLLIKIETITIDTFLPVRNKFVYSYSIKICALGFDELLKSIFCLLLVVEAFSQKKVVKMLEEVVVGCWEVRWIWWMRQNFVAQFIQLLKWMLVVQCAVERCQENWALSVNQCWLQALQLFMHLIDLLSILLRYDGFAEIQKVVVD